MTQDQAIERATAVVNGLSDVGGSEDALQTLVVAVYLVVMMSAQDRDEADEMMDFACDAMRKRMVHYDHDAATILATRKRRGRNA